MRALVDVTTTGWHPKNDRASVQLALKGMWIEACEGCPHRVGQAEGPARCGQPGYDMTVCIYELDDVEGCETFKQIIHEWQEEYHLYRYEPDPYRRCFGSVPIGGRLI